MAKNIHIESPSQSLQIIEISGGPNPNKNLCGKRPNIAQGKFNPMIPCGLKPNHKGKHAWQEIRYKKI